MPTMPPVHRPNRNRNSVEVGPEGYDRRRRGKYPWRGWYKLKAWKDLRRARLIADNWLCQMHLAQGEKVPAKIVDHIKPHRGDRSLFFAFSNTQSLCKACHDQIKQREERGSIQVYEE